MPVHTQAVILDLDGLMVNTERLSFQAYQELLAPRGYALEEADFRELVGLDFTDSARYVLEVTGAPLELEPFVGEHRRLLMEKIDRELEPSAGVVDLVSALKRRGLPLAITSNSPTEYVRRVLAAIHLTQAFVAIVGRDQVQAPKPSPESYLAAARKIAEQPSACLAIEDSVVGMRSAVDAGMRCVIVSDMWDDPAFIPAVARFATAEELTANLDRVLIARQAGF